MSDIFEIQPDWCRKPLPFKEFEWSDWELEYPKYVKKWERVLRYDPTELYERIGHLIDPHKRILSIGMYEFFPPKGTGLCDCGCGQKLEGRRSRWATHECSSFVFAVRSIICNIHQIPSDYITRYFGEKCVECEGIENLQLDHIIGVKHGGGGCWLPNYQWLCRACHTPKTNKDFGWKSKNPTTQIKIKFK